MDSSQKNVGHSFWASASLRPEGSPVEFSPDEKEEPIPDEELEKIKKKRDSFLGKP